ncbi:PTS system mannose/fructose/N-acetylgalactosamine-transporter subunit IIB [Kibdelosporangium aridum]|uniref:PTS system, mannose-specific IIB component n=1 Tax=Kibdelosporangium aridum TaxID=2030 RepID=A0A1W2DJ13_KIBAR|nr:PTS sugar transporter subunit IIB [Kibdelosporangium aridum]SMC97435.1 PTS system, mannose-specific IIB component [Kibdelosporangium aridum]
MSRVHLRIDNRLIHGQVTVVWTGQLGVEHIVVANDEVAADEIQRMLLPQAARGLPTSVLEVGEVQAWCRDHDDLRVLVIAKHPEDAFELLRGGLDVSEVVVGNAAARPGEQTTRLTRWVAVTAGQARTYRELAESGTRFVCRLMPTDKGSDLVSLLGKKGL